MLHTGALDNRCIELLNARVFFFEFEEKITLVMM